MSALGQNFGFLHLCGVSGNSDLFVWVCACCQTATSSGETLPQVEPLNVCPLWGVRKGSLLRLQSVTRSSMFAIGHGQFVFAYYIGQNQHHTCSALKTYSDLNCMHSCKGRHRNVPCLHSPNEAVCTFCTLPFPEQLGCSFSVCAA